MSTTNTRVEAHRLDAARVRIDTPSGLDIALFANEQVPVDRASLAEIGTLSGIGCQTPSFKSTSSRHPALKLATTIVDFAKENAVTGKLLIKWSWVRVPAGSPIKSM